MKRILTLGLALLMLILAGCSTEVTEYRQQQPALDIFHYFQGRTEAWALHSQFDTIFSVASIIRKKCGFVNKKMQNRAVQCVCCPHFGARATSAAALTPRSGHGAAAALRQLFP